MKIIGANVTGSFILNSQDVTTTIQTSNVWSGSVATDITALNASTASLNRATSSLNAATASLLNYTSSNNAAIADILLETASFNAFSSSILNYTSSTTTAIADILLETASINLLTASLLSYTSSQNNRNGTYATTGSNTFTGVQTINSNLVVTGSITAQTLIVQTITSSQDFVTGSTKFGSLAINTHQFTGSVIITGSLNATAFTGSGAGLTSIPNAALTNSTISGIALGSNLATLTIGTGLSGTSYNGSGAVTIANTGVTSNVAGTGITVSGATGAVTITNSGVTSNVAGTGVTVSGATGAVTISIGQSVATSATPSFGKVFLTTNLATGVANNGFNTAKSILGNIHMQNGDGTSGDNKQAAITFQGGNSSEAQAGIYVSNNNSTGTAMGFATTDSYATGPQLFMTATNTGLVNFPRAVPTYAGTSLVYNSGTWAISTTGNAATATAAAGATFLTQPNATWAARIQLGGNGDPGAVANTAVVQATDGNLHIDCGTGKTTYINYYRNGIIYLNGATYYISSNGSQYNGNSATATNAYGARFQFDSYGNWAPGGAGGAAIVNSNEAIYQALMIVGNSSAGGVRVVKLWDNLQVQGSMSATADITAYFSDGRLKENLQPLKNAISKITTLTGYTYNTNALGKKLLNNENINDSKVGLIAQDLQKVLPEAVKLAPFDNDGKDNSKSGENYLTIQYEKVVPLLIEAMKEQQTQIEELKTIINGLTK
jgi:hypothetical protein